MQSKIPVATGPSELKISGHNTPGTLTLGKSYSIYGIVSSNYNITSLNVRVLNSQGIAVTYKAVVPNAKTYSIGNVDPYIYFDRLAKGNYRYQIIATDASGVSKMLVDSSFVVK